MLLVDTSAPIDILQDDPEWADWSIQQLRAQAQLHELAINPIIYSELSPMYESIEDLEQTVAALGLSFQEIPRPALFVAAKAFIRYQREGGTKQNVLPDFLLGGHAVVGGPVLTRDPARYRSYFPTVELLTPEPGARS